MKKLAIMIVLISLLLLTGCLPQSELNQKAIVEAMGIDYNNGSFTVSLEIFTPQQNEEKENYYTISAKGKTINTAVEELSFIEDKKLFYEFNKIIVINTDCAREKFDEVEEFLNFGENSRLTTEILVSVQDTEKFMAKNQGVGQELLNSLKTSKDSGNTVSFEFYKLLEKNQKILPCIEQKGENFAIIRAAVFDDNNFEILSWEKTKALALIYGKIKEKNLDLAFGDARLNLDLYNFNNFVSKNNSVEIACDAGVKTISSKNKISKSRLEGEIEQQLYSQCREIANENNLKLEINVNLKRLGVNGQKYFTD